MTENKAIEKIESYRETLEYVRHLLETDARFGRYWLANKISTVLGDDNRDDSYDRPRVDVR